MGDSVEGIGSNGIGICLPNDLPLGRDEKGRDLYTPSVPNAGVTALGGSLLSRGETSSSPLWNKDAFSSYSDFKASDFADERDIRLTQLRRVAQGSNDDLIQRLESVLEYRDIENVSVAGRAKTESSLFNKLLQSPSSTIGNLNDVSAVRFNIDVQKAAHNEFYQLKNLVEQDLYQGTALATKDFIANPSTNGYTGRIHMNLPGDRVPLQELQIGSQDLTAFIDKTFRTTGGDVRSLHDLVYKGNQYGLELSPEIKASYQDLMSVISNNDRLGLTIAKNPELTARLNSFYSAVARELPDSLPPIPDATLNMSQKVKGLLGKGFGALGVLGALYQANDGKDKLIRGQTIDGTTDVMAGTSAAVSSVALMGGRTLLSAGTGGIAAGLEGTRDIYLGISQGDNERIARGGAKGTASGLMMAGAYTANPFVIGAGAALYLGTAVYENRQAIGTLATSAYDYSANAVSNAWNWAWGE